MANKTLLYFTLIDASIYGLESIFCCSVIVARRRQYAERRYYDYFALLKLRFSLECGMWIKVI